MTLHAHVSTESADCDGRISRDYIEEMLPRELEGQDQNNWFGDIHFHNRMVANTVNTYSILNGGKLTVSRVGESGSDTMMEWVEPTEEGWNHKSVRFCEDDCNLTVRGYRDHSAEAAGY